MSQGQFRETGPPARSDGGDALRGHLSVRRGSRSESEVKARTDAEIVFDPGCRVRKLRPQPGDLEGAQSKVAGKLKVHAATHLQSQTVRTVGRPSEAGKTLSKP